MSFNGPRMKDYMKPEDLNTDGCVELAAFVLREASEAYLEAARALKRHPDSKDSQAH